MGMMQTQGGNPTGGLGRLIGSLMNRNHQSIYNLGLSLMDSRPDMALLDIGCGGGAFLRLAAERFPSAAIYGIDHSRQMVTLARRVTRCDDHVEVVQASVSQLPYADGFFDTVTAFETIQFWPDIPGDLNEIRRVLKEDGTLLIINRYPEEGTKWHEWVQVKSAEAYTTILTEAGFGEISTDTAQKDGWIVVIAHRTEQDQG